MKRALALILSLAMCFALAACGAKEEAPAEKPAEAPAEQPAEEKETLTIALLPKTLSNPYFVAMQQFAEEAAASLSTDKLTVEIVASAPPTEDGINEQITMFESYLEKGVDGVLIVPCGTSEVVPTIAKANEKDVPVICLDTNADAGAEVAAFIGTNNYDGGFLAGEWTAENVEGEVAIITGMLGNQCHTDRTNGYLDGVKAATDAGSVTLVGEIQPCNGDQGTAMGIAENLLTAYPNLKCIYVTNDTGALGAAAAVKAAGRDVMVIGFDGSPDGAQSIVNGEMTATVAQTPGVMAKEGVTALVELITAGTAPEDMYTACAMVTADNAEEYLNWH